MHTFPKIPKCELNNNVTILVDFASCRKSWIISKLTFKENRYNKYNKI
jgi:hypothetical protein